MELKSKQERYQDRHRAQGLCTICPRPASKGERCEIHKLSHNEQEKSRYEERIKRGISSH